MIPVHVISLRRTPDRRAALAVRLRTLGIAFEFLDAIDGQALTDAEALRLCPKRFALKQRWPLSKSQVACAESHVRAMRTILDSNADWACVLEDDADPQPDFADFLDQTWLASLPAFDAIKLSADWAGRRDERALSIGARGDRRLCVPLRPAYSCMAYVVSRDGARKLVRQAACLQDSADVNFFRSPAWDARILDVRPMVVTSIGQPSTITADPSYHPPVPRWRAIAGWLPHNFDQWARQARRYSAFVRWRGVGALRRLERIPLAGAPPSP